MSALTDLKTFWQATAGLQGALPVASIYLDLVPPDSPYPYGALTVISSVPTYVTASSHIETFHFQLSLWHTNLDALSNLADTIQANLDNTRPNSSSLIMQRVNRITRTEVTDQAYTYNVILEYNYQFNQA